MRARKTAVLAALFLLLGARVPAAADDLVVFVVRHAEKVAEGDDPPLSASGRARAAALADLLEEAGIVAVHSSDFRRTLETAAPLAERLGLPILLYDPAGPQPLVDRMLRDGGRHLVIGHSNTAPELVERLGGDGGTAIDEHSEYDRLYVVMPSADGGPARTLLLRYGERFSP